MDNVEASEEVAKSVKEELVAIREDQDPQEVPDVITKNLGFLSPSWVD